MVINYCISFNKLFAIANFELIITYKTGKESICEI